MQLKGDTFKGAAYSLQAFLTKVHVQLTRVPVHLTRVLLTRAQLAEVWLQQNGVMLPFIDAQKRWEWGPIQEHYKSKTALAAVIFLECLLAILSTFERSSLPMLKNFSERSS